MHFPQANLVYPAVVLAHAGLGLLASIGILWQVLRNLKRQNWLAATAWLVLAVGALVGAALDLYRYVASRITAAAHTHTRIVGRRRSAAGVVVAVAAES